MPQIIQETSLGSSLGQALGSGLGQLIAQRVENLKMREGLGSLGIPKEEANKIAKLPPAIQQEIIKNYMQGAQNAQFGDLLSGITGTSESRIADTPLDNNATPLDSLKQLATPTTQEQQPGISREMMQAAQPVTQKEQSFTDILSAPNLTPERQMKLAELQMKRESELRKERGELRKESIAEQREIDKETKEFYKETLGDYRDALETNRRIERMEELVRNGKLDSPLFSSALNTASKGIFGFGIDLSSLRSPDSQEFKKLSTEFLKNAKNLFGNRVTDNEIRMFMQMVPTLVQSDKGKLRVINNMKAYNQAATVRKRAMDQLIEANNGRRPRNIESKVEDLASSQLDVIAQQFKKGYNIEAEPVEEKSGLKYKLGKLADWLGDI